MGASPLMSLGLRAMAASYAAMQATGHNIANANVAGYSRQQAELATSPGQYTGSGFFGKGVDVKTVARAHDEFLTRAAAIARSLSSMDAARQGRLVQLEKVFAGGEGGIGYSMGQFLNSMVDLASRPSDNATRQVVLARAQDLVSRFNGAASQFDSLQAGLTEDMKTSADAVNGIAKSLAAVNQQIAAVRGVGQPPNDLMDERDRLISQLSAYVQVSTVGAEDGTLGVFIAGGQRLVLGTDAAKLEITPDPVDPSRSSLALVEGATRRVVSGDSLGGGSLAGLLRFQNEDLVDGRNLVGQLAAAIAGTVNAQQMLGVNLQEPAGTVPSRPLFAVGGAQAVPATTNAKADGGGYAASITLTVVDATALQSADYVLRPDPAGGSGYEVTRLSKPPVTRLIANGDVVDGMRIDVADPPPISTDRFLLKPVAAAAGGLTALLSDPRDLAAASPLIAALNPANTGTAKAATFTMVSLPPQPTATTTITFTSDVGDYTWELVAADGTRIDAGGGTWQAGDTIPPEGTDFNGFVLGLSGVPRTGDRIDVIPTPAEALKANNGNALAMSGLRDLAFIGRTMQADGTVSGGSGATDAYASAMAAIGVRVQSSKATAEISASVSQQAEQVRSSSAGVNLDEEAARLIQYQQSYQAAAKVLQIAQSVFQTLLETTT